MAKYARLVLLVECLTALVIYVWATDRPSPAMPTGGFWGVIGFAAAFVGLALLVRLAWRALGVPLIVRFQQKMQAHPKLKPLDLKQLDPSISQFLMKQTEALIGLGFDEPTLLEASQAMKNVSQYVILLVNRETGDKAMVTAVIARGATTIQSCAVEFSTRFDSGELFDTHNSPTLPAFPPLPCTMRTQVPMVSDSRELFDLHRYVMNKHSPSGKKTLFEPGTAREYLVEFAYFRTYQGQAQRGWLHYSEAEDVFRFTFKGAYLVTWGLLPPIKTMRWAAMHRRARRLLHEFQL
jgi:hypothetical protein